MGVSTGILVAFLLFNLVRTYLTYLGEWYWHNREPYCCLICGCVMCEGDFIPLLTAIIFVLIAATLARDAFLGLPQITAQDPTGALTGYVQIFQGMAIVGALYCLYQALIYFSLWQKRDDVRAKKNA